MKNDQFHAATKELQELANSLPTVVKQAIKGCVEALERGRKRDGDTPEQVAAENLRQVRDRIELIMAHLDSAMRSIEMPPFFNHSR